MGASQKNGTDRSHEREQAKNAPNPKRVEHLLYQILYIYIYT